MRTLLTIAILLISVFSLDLYAQEKKDSVKSTAAAVRAIIPDTVALITTQQFNELFSLMRKTMTIEQQPLFDLYARKMQDIYNTADSIYRRKNPKLK